MKQDFIGEKNIKNIEKIESFGKKNYYVHTSPLTGSVIGLDFNQIQQYQQKVSQRGTEHKTKHGDITYEAFSKQQEPINLTKEQQRIQKKIIRGDDKESRITASQLSVICENDEDHKICYRCEDKDFEIESLKVQVQEHKKSEERLRLQNVRLSHELQIYNQKCISFKRQINKARSHVKSKISVQSKDIKNQISNSKSSISRTSKEAWTQFEQLYNSSFQKYFISEIENLDENLS